MPAMSPSTFQRAFADKISHAFVPGIGYVRLGIPALPRVILGPAEDCEPIGQWPALSVHALHAPHGEVVENFRWYPETRQWAPLVPSAGNRIAFTSRYLAAHGWKYAYSQ